MVETEKLISCRAKGFQYGGQDRECRWPLFLGRCVSSVECNLPLLDYAGSPETLSGQKRTLSDDFRRVLVQYHTIGSLWQCQGHPQSLLFNLPRPHKGG